MIACESSEEHLDALKFKSKTGYKRPRLCVQFERHFRLQLSHAHTFPLFPLVPASPRLFSTPKVLALLHLFGDRDVVL